jgi:hypothetical protein
VPGASKKGEKSEKRKKKPGRRDGGPSPLGIENLRQVVQKPGTEQLFKSN